MHAHFDGFAQETVMKNPISRVTKLRFKVEVGYAVAEVEGATREEAIAAARRCFCLEMPRLWDRIQAIDVARFRVRALSPSRGP